MSRKPVTTVLRFPRVVNGDDPQPPQPKAAAVTNRRITGLLPITRERIGYAFLHGSTMRTLRVSYGLCMASLEEIIRDEMRLRMNRKAAA
jgi:hypothetical protein